MSFWPAGWVPVETTICGCPRAVGAADAWAGGCWGVAQAVITRANPRENIHLLMSPAPQGFNVNTISEVLSKQYYNQKVRPRKARKHYTRTLVDCTILHSNLVWLARTWTAISDDHQESISRTRPARTHRN